MGKPATGSMTWPGGTVYTQVIKDSAGTTLKAIEADQPDDPVQFNKEGQKQSYATFRKWDRCYSCGIEFPEDELMEFQGRKYGVPCGDYKDIPQLASRGKSTTRRAE